VLALMTPNGVQKMEPFLSNGGYSGITPPSTPRFALTEMAVILNFGSETMSGNARSDIFKSDMVDNMGIAVGISAP
jgi:hypothetical protein